MQSLSAWPHASLRDVTLTTKTWNPSTEYRPTIKYVDVSAVSRQSLQITSSQDFRGDEAPGRARKIVKSGDTIFATIRPSLRRIAQVDSDFDNEVVSTAFCVLRPNPARITSDYLFYAMQSRPINNRIAAQQSGASYPAVRDGDILDQDIPLPPLCDQHTIANILNLIRNSLSLEGKALEKHLALKQAAMRDMFSRGLRHDSQKHTEFGPVPEQWKLVSLESCSVVQTGVAKGRKLPDSEEVEVPYLRVANVQDGHLDLSEMKMIKIRKSELERYLLRVGDVVLTEGGDFDKLGRGFIWRGELDGCVHQNHVFAIRPATRILAPDFLAYLIQSQYGKAYFLKVAHKTTNLACINSTKLKAFPVPLPAIDEQNRIVQILHAIDRRLDLQRRKIELLTNLFQNTLEKLIGGEISTSDFNFSFSKKTSIMRTTV